MDVKIEFVSFGLACGGWFCTILTRFLPMWNVSGMVENTTTTLPLYWDGVWLNWQYHTTGRVHCVFYQTLLSLTQHFSQWKILLLTSIAMGFIAVALYPMGWIRYPKYIRIKAASGPWFIASGIPLLIVISWTTHLTELKSDDLSLTRELGAAIFSGWIGLVLLVLGGGVLSFICCKGVRKQQEDGRQMQTAEPGVQDPLNTVQSTGFMQSPRTG